MQCFFIYAILYIIGDKMEIVDNKCPTCGSSIEFDISTQNWKCKHCRNNFTIEDMKKVKHNTKKSLNELLCPTCNAILLTNENDISTKCIYCRNNVIINKTSDKVPIPDKIIPFRIGKKETKKIIKEYLEDKQFLPKDFSVNKYINDIQGIYIPFWLYKNKYKVSVRKNYMRHDKAEVEFENIPFDANKHLNNKVTSSLEPFDYKELIKFNSAYLSGFMAQKYDVDESSGRKDVKDRCTSTIEMLFKDANSKYYEPQIELIQETLIEEKAYYALLPIWLLNFKYNNNEYLIAINGQTGKITASLPVDETKLSKQKLKIMFITFIISILIFIFLRWMGWI